MFIRVIPHKNRGLEPAPFDSLIRLSSQGNHRFLSMNVLEFPSLFPRLNVVNIKNILPRVLQAAGGFNLKGTDHDFC